MNLRSIGLGLLCASGTLSHVFAQEAGPWFATTPDLSYTYGAPATVYLSEAPCPAQGNRTPRQSERWMLAEVRGTTPNNEGVVPTGRACWYDVPGYRMRVWCVANARDVQSNCSTVSYSDWRYTNPPAKTK